MRILITGATGFVGKTLIPYLYDKGLTDMALLIRNENKANLLFPTQNLTLIEIGNQVQWREKVIEYNPEIVVHMATLFDAKCDANSAEKIIQTNILFTTLLLEAISKTDCTHFIHIGTFTEFRYGTEEYFANNFYSASKTAVRSIIKFYQTQAPFRWINLVLYSPYGKYNDTKKVLDYMIDALDAPTPVNFSQGEQILDFIHVDDIADFFYSLLSQIDKMKDRYIELHLGTGKGHSIREVASVMELVWGKKIQANWGGIPYRAYDTMYAVAPIAKNIELLGWKAKLSIESGIQILHDDLIRRK